MKNLTKTLFLLLTLLSLAFSNVYAVSITATILDDYIEVGETFDVQIWADSGMPTWELTGFGFDIDDSADNVLSYVNHTLDPFIYADVSDPSSPYNVSGVTFPGQMGNTMITTLSFAANEAGTGSFSLLGGYDGFFYGLFYVDFIADPSGPLFPGEDIFLTQEITVNAIETGSEPVPEPSTIFLFGGSLMGFALYRRKRKTK